VQRAAFRTISQIGIRYRQSPLSRTLDGVSRKAPQAGDRFPWLRLKYHAQGAPDDLFQRMDDTRFSLIVIGQPAPSAASLGLDDMLQVHAIAADAENNRVLAAASITNPAYFLVRPDGHIGLAGTQFQEADLKRWLTTSSLRLEGGKLAEV
jgi:hypothetical protein